MYARITGTASSLSTMRKLVEDVLGLRIRDYVPYVDACTHHTAEALRGTCQERLELLGDAILQACVTRLLFDRYPYADEGALSKLRVKIVNGQTLATIGRRLGLDRLIIVGDGFVLTDKVFEDTLEALVAAVYVDQGFDVALQWVRDVLRRTVDAEYLTVEDNYKDVLRRFALRQRISPPVYSTVREGDTHACECRLVGVSGAAAAPTKRQAERLAALEVLTQLGYDPRGESLL